MYEDLKGKRLLILGCSHYGQYSIAECKEFMAGAGVPVRRI